ncbi:SBP (S-ribonuclease binding protein) family protein [Tasmannia lanceolata]|uniref:SBP (S-ribonuclease binding protein) family protein n=1 Tax=Tasmannia lanceolata TaxID=3420 RepID=UPI0040630FC0
MAVQSQQCQENFSFPSFGLQEWMEIGGGFYDFHQSDQTQNQQNLILEAYLEKQRQEMDRFIILQNERLRTALQNQRKEQLFVYMRKVEEKVTSLLRKKEEEILQADRKKVELEDMLRKLEMENLTWQKIGKENEAMVLFLRNSLQKVKENIFLSKAEDAESCCVFSNQINGSIKGEREESEKMICKACNYQYSCVLFLPCRHLCSCKSCEGLLDSCPVCNSVKEASIEVFMI